MDTQVGQYELTHPGEDAVELTAVLSALNSGLFASSRMLLAMAQRGDAPQGLAKLSSRGVPSRAILTGTVFGYCAVIMSYVSPEGVFAFLVSSYGTVAIFVYVLIASAQLRLRAGSATGTQRTAGHNGQWCCRSSSHPHQVRLESKLARSHRP